MVDYHRAEEDGGIAGGAVYVSPEMSQEFLARFPGGMFRYRDDEDGTLDYVNPGMLELYGCESYEQFRTLTGNTFKGLVHPDDWERVSEEIRQQLGEGDHDRVLYRILCANGEERWVDDCGQLVIDSAGTRWFYVTIMDITDRVRDEKRIRRANERLEIITALSNDVLFDIECATGDAHVYGDFEGRFGRAPQQSDFVVHRRCKNPCNLDITSHDLSDLVERISGNSLVDFETSMEGRGGERVWYRYQSVVLYDDEGGPVRHVGRLLDTHDAAMRESMFRRKAERDGLTGLYNRTAALDRIESILHAESRPCTLIIVDVDDFKQVNDVYGHPEGDRVLKRLAEFLSHVMRKEDVIARIGGDEFAIFAPGLGPGPAMDRVLGRLAEGPFVQRRSTDKAQTEATEHEGCQPGGTAAPSISIGAACCMNPPMPFAELYEAADQTLYDAKEAGKARYHLKVIE